MEISGLGIRQEILASGQLPDAQEVSSRIIQKMDQDGDGLLNTSELGKHAERLAGADQNEDGLIGQDELVQQMEAKMAEFGGFKPGEKPNIHKLKSMMGMMQQKFTAAGGPASQENDLFSLLDSLETSEDDKQRLKSLMENNPFDISV